MNFQTFKSEQNMYSQDIYKIGKNVVLQKNPFTQAMYFRSCRIHFLVVSVVFLQFCQMYFLDSETVFLGQIAM